VSNQPSIQTRFLLDVMEEYERQDASHWEQMMESLDLLFARVTDIGRDQ